MKIERIAARNVGAIKSVEIDLREFDGKVVCLWGDNGSGKTTILEFIPGALWRETPSQGYVGNHAHDTEGLIEIDAVSDRRYRITQRIGPKQSSSVVADGNEVVLSAGGVREYDRWAANTLLSPDLYYAGLFVAQQSAKHLTSRFIDMSAGDRKAVLLRAIGVERLERLAELARKRKRECDKDLSAKQALVHDVSKQHSKAMESQQSVDEATRLVDDLSLKNSEASARVGVARKSRDAVSAAHASASERAQAWLRASHAIARLEKERTDVDTRLTNNERVLSGADAIRAASKRHQQLGELLASLDEKIAADTDGCAADQADVIRLKGEASRAATDKERADGAVRRAKAVLRDEPNVTSASESVKRLRGDLTAWEVRQEGAAKRIENLRRRSVHGAFDRVENLGEHLEEISHWSTRGADHALNQIEAYASSGLQKDDEAAAINRCIPQEMEDAQEEAKCASNRVAEINSSLRQASRLAGQAATMEAAHEDLRRAQDDGWRANNASTALARSVPEAEERATASRKKLDQLKARQQKLRTEREEIQKRAAMMEALLQADAKVASYKERLEAIRREIGEHEQVPKDADYEGLSKRLQDATEHVSMLDEEASWVQKALEDARMCARLAQGQAEHAQALQVRMLALIAEAEAGLKQVKQWERMAADLGINGLQAMEIDGAGPELTSLANELLHQCYGLRWTITVEATRATSKKNKLAEGCFVKVLDTEQGRHGMIETFSGGEKVLIGEAISLALTILACRKARIDQPTLIRDETGGALDGNKAVAYVKMLRHAMRMTNAHAVIFVSQSGTVASMADVVVEIQNGSVVVTDPVDEEVTAS